MLLYSVSALRDELGFDNLTDITTGIADALHTAEALLGATLRTSFDAKVGVVDTFAVADPTLIRAGIPQTEFLLSNGFVTGSPTLSGGVISAIDTDKGIIRDWVTYYTNTLVTVTYNCGFAVAGDDPTSYDLTQVPKWLQQAAKLKALMLLAKHPSITEAQIQLDTSVLDQQYAALVNRHIRYCPLGILPL